MFSRSCVHARFCVRDAVAVSGCRHLVVESGALLLRVRHPLLQVLDVLPPPNQTSSSHPLRVGNETAWDDPDMA
eukprot:121429-Rhodomonas_salina.1